MATVGLQYLFLRMSENKVREAAVHSAFWEEIRVWTKGKTSKARASPGNALAPVMSTGLCFGQYPENTLRDDGWESV